MEGHSHKLNNYNLLRFIKIFNSKWLNVSISGIILGILAQFLRQIHGPLMFLGASTAPWVFIGFLLAFSATRTANTLRKSFLIATGSVAIYLVLWLVSYHLLFVFREHVTLVVGWHQIAPWLVATIPSSLIIGIFISLSHRQGVFGDITLAIPLAWSLPETFNSFKESWGVGIVFVIPISFLSILLIYMAKNERRVNLFNLFKSVLILGLLSIALFSVAWFLLLGRY
jgi:hypothetical protein